ncbi:MAG: UDP-N-acetylmuramate dehydrogenase [Bacteroidota bacterium]|nr:UDP-N-acetylmuramate dehydrogenase [Bacteroidota bacterium]
MIQVKENFSLKGYNTFDINVCAKYFSEFSTVSDLEDILENFRGHQQMILGGGSNILFTKNFDGIVLKNNIPAIDVVNEDEEYVYVKAGAGVSWHQFVMYCVNNNFGGVENLSLIPGNVGASPMQNIGAYGVEIKDVFFELNAWNLAENNIQNFNNADCEFGYRESFFKKKYKGQFVILTVTFRLRRRPLFNVSYGAINNELEKMNVSELSIKAISDAVISIRQSKLPDPAIVGNAGSFFKNPGIDSQGLRGLTQIEPEIPFYKLDEEKFKIPAGWLIEQCGWKGFRKGDAGCYDKQALVLVNYGNAAGEEIFALSEKIKVSVQEKFGIELEREVNII